MDCITVNELAHHLFRSVNANVINLYALFCEFDLNQLVLLAAWSKEKIVILWSKV
jgi:hypothetical protein